MNVEGGKATKPPLVDTPELSDRGGDIGGSTAGSVAGSVVGSLTKGGALIGRLEEEKKRRERARGNSFDGNESWVSKT